VLYDEDKQVWKSWKRDVNSLPQLFLVDGQGTIRWRRIGMASEDALREQIEEQLGQLD
jgi:deoxyinosine 3'endonuclease (endonuclease V)